MKTIVENSYTEETHPWDWYIPENANKLLIGTFPTEARNRKHDFFYCSSTNRFWEILSALQGKSVSLLEGENGIIERHKLLESLSLGLTDMGKKIIRQRGSSKDHSLFPLEFMDILKLLNLFPNIETLILSGDVQGNSSLSWFNTYCSINGIKLNLKELKKEKHILTSAFGRGIAIKMAYSPSRLSRKETIELVDNYRLVLTQDQSP